ncbi:MAG: serine hydrolase [Bacteroidales bacterium]|nr:serine hydrolase [Bacteroidales bacterium]
MRIIKIILLVIISVISSTLLLPGFSFIPNALIYQQPGIDDYKIFYNRVVFAGDPKPWKISKDYFTSPLSKEFDDINELYKTTAYLVVKDTSLLFEHYYDDSGEDVYSNSFSMAKSIVSLLIGIAIDEGKIASIDERVGEYLPNYNDSFNKNLTIRNLLTMSAALDWEEGYKTLFSTTAQAYYGGELNKFISKFKSISESGDKVKYQSGVTQILSMVLSKATNENLSQYASERLWTPINAEKNALWSLDKKDGDEKAYCCFNSNARDFARLGQLVLNKGVWNNKRILSQQYIDEAVKPASYLKSQYDDSENTVYGFQFWIYDYNGESIPFMRGLLGQYVFILPKYNAVIVRLGHTHSNERDENHFNKDIEIWIKEGIDIIEKGNR